MTLRYRENKGDCQRVEGWGDVWNKEVELKVQTCIYKINYLSVLTYRITNMLINTLITLCGDRWLLGL